MTRDAWVEGWLFEEDADRVPTKFDLEHDATEGARHGAKTVEADPIALGTNRTQMQSHRWGEVLGSGYPSGSSASRIEPCMGKGLSCVQIQRRRLG